MWEPLTSSAASLLRRSNSLGHGKVGTAVGHGRALSERASPGLHVLGWTDLR